MSNAAERVYKMVKAEILAGALEPGQPLRESALGRKYDVSRTPVRDALKHLLSDGLIEFIPNAGARVVSISQETAEEISNIRALLEGHAAALAAHKATKEDLARLRDISADMERAIAEDGQMDIERVATSNNAFHAAIVEIAANSQLTAALNQVINAPLILRKFASFSADRARASVRQHEEIVTAIASGDARWAEAAMRTHIFSARNLDAHFADKAPAAIADHA